MRTIVFDLDTLRADHLGCYGYARNTSPNIDSIAKDGVLFDNYYCPNAPCLPSRASWVSGRYGLINGVVGHSGTAADMRLEGENRGFLSNYANENLFGSFRKAGMYTVSFSTFAERHSAFWFYAGFNEIYNVGKGGMESAEEVVPKVLDWLSKNGEKDNWCLHINLWDAHTPYRAPAEYGNPFETIPLADDWIDQKEFEKHKNHIGPHSANEINMWDDNIDEEFPRYPGKLENLSDVKHFIDMYDTGIQYMDAEIGKILSYLKEKGLYNEDLNIIVTSDHGENMGELGIYGEHATACHATCNIPMIIKWRGALKDKKLNALHTNVDLLPTICDLFNIEKSNALDGESFYSELFGEEEQKRDYVVLCQCAHVCQRAVVFDDYIYIYTYHGGYHLFDDDMLFNLKNDKHMTKNLANERLDLCAQGRAYIFEWENTYMKKSPYTVDPLWTVMKEGGPFHAKGQLNSYIDRLKKTGREKGAELLQKKYSEDIK